MYKNYKIGWSNYDKKRWSTLEQLFVRDFFNEWKRIDDIKLSNLPLSKIYNYLRKCLYLNRSIRKMTNFQSSYFYYLIRYEKNYK